MAFECLSLTTTAGGVGTITLKRPEKLNALSRQLEDELREATAQVATDGAVRVLVLTGAGRAFSAGGDVSGMGPGGGWDLPTAERRARFQALHQVAMRLQTMPQPTIAMVNGVAAGAGCNLALACDVRIAAAGARFGLAFVRVGLGDDMGGAWLLPRLVGVGQALELFLSGDLIDAEEALRIGMVNRVVPAENLHDETYALATRLAQGPPRAQALIKETVYRGLGMGLQELLDFEAERQSEQMSHPEHEEGVSAFLEKRQPRFPA